MCRTHYSTHTLPAREGVTPFPVLKVEGVTGCHVPDPSISGVAIKGSPREPGTDSDRAPSSMRAVRGLFTSTLPHFEVGIFNLWNVCLQSRK